MTEFFLILGAILGLPALAADCDVNPTAVTIRQGSPYFSSEWGTSCHVGKGVYRWTKKDTNEVFFSKEWKNDPNKFDFTNSDGKVIGQGRGETLSPEMYEMELHTEGNLLPERYTAEE